MAGATGEKPAAGGPRRGELIEVEIDSLAFGGRGVARTDGFVVFVAGALPGDRVAGRGDEGEEALRRGTNGRAAARRRRPRRRHLHPWRRALPRRPLAGPPLRAPARPQAASRSPRRCVGSAGSTASSWRRSSRPSSSGATATSSSTPSAKRTAEPILGFHARGRWDLIVDVDDCHLASEAGNAARNGVREWARLESVPAFDRRAMRGVLRNLVVREGRRTGQIQTRLVTAPLQVPAPAGRPAHRGRGRLRRHRRPDRRARRGAPARGALRLEAGRSPTAPSSRPTPRWPSASTRSRRSSPA